MELSNFGLWGDRFPVAKFFVLINWSFIASLDIFSEMMSLVFSGSGQMW